jgi:hypothetical protein
MVGFTFQNLLRTASDIGDLFETFLLLDRFMDESSSKQPARPFLQQPPPGRRPKTLSEFFADCLR